MEKILARIEREVGFPGLAAALGENLSLTDLQSLLLAVYRKQAGRRRPADLLKEYELNRFVRPAAVAPTLLLAWEQAAFQQLPYLFQPICLSPVSPLGTVSALTNVDQNWAVATIRNTEVVSDSTNVLALECARRRRDHLRKNSKSTARVHLAATHRLTRAQGYQDPAARAHFSLFGLCSGGRDQGNLVFERDTLLQHIQIYLQAVQAFVRPAPPLQVTLTDFHLTPRTALLDRLRGSILSAFPGIRVTFDHQRLQGRGYYQDLCFKIHAAGPDGQPIELADGGVVDWTQQLLNNAKERLVISGIGSERVCSLAAPD